MQNRLYIQKNNTEIIQALTQELEFALELARSKKSSLAYRIFIRTAFSHMEAMIWIVKQTALTFSDSPTPEHIQFADEEAYRIGENGLPERDQAKISLVKNIQFALHFASEVFDTKFQLDRSAHQWGWLRDAIKIRDGITHPKNIEVLQITDEQFSRSVDSILWVALEMNAVMEAAQRRFHQVSGPITQLASTAIEETRAKLSTSEEFDSDQLFKFAEAVAEKISSESLGQGYDQTTLMARIFEEMITFKNENPDVDESMPEDAKANLQMRMKAIFGQEAFASKLVGIDAKLMLEFASQIKTGQEEHVNQYD